MIWIRQAGLIILLCLMSTAIAHAGAANDSNAVKSGPVLKGTALDDQIPGIPIPPSPVDGSLGEERDIDDVYRIHLNEGQMLTVELGPSQTLLYDVFLYSPSTRIIQEIDGLGSPNILASSASDYLDSLMPRQITYVVPKGKGGVYYLDVYRQSGTGNYGLHYFVKDFSPDDLLPGAPLPPSPLSGELNITDDVNDIYRVELKEGQILTANIDVTRDSPSDEGRVEMALLPPDARTLDDNQAVGWEHSGKMVYQVPSGKSGTYSLWAECFRAPAEYTLRYSIFTPEANDDIPGGKLRSFSIHDSLSEFADVDDVYRLELKGGQILEATLKGAANTQFDILLYPPDTTKIGISPAVIAPDWHDKKYPRYFSYPVPPGKGGTYYLDVHCSSGAGAYDLGLKINQLAITGLTRSGYRVDRLRTGKPLYGDREYFFTEMPGALNAQLYLQTRNRDKNLNAPWSFQVNVPVEVVVIYNRLTKKRSLIPAWLSDWQGYLGIARNERLQTSNADQRCRFFTKKFPAGKITLGGNRDAGMPESDQTMYTVVVIPQLIPLPCF